MKNQRASYLAIPRVLAIAMSCFAAVANASDMELVLQVKSAHRRVSTKRTDEQPSLGKPQPRPVFLSKQPENLVVSWKATSVAKRETFKDVLIHCVVVSEKEPGQATLPSLKDPVQESAISMDFKPGSSASGEFLLTIDEPGAYLVRVETRNMAETHGHEHFAALDLVRE